MRNKECEEEDLDSRGNGFADDARVSLPRAEPYRRDLSSSVQLEESNFIRHFLTFLEARLLHSGTNWWGRRDGQRERDKKCIEEDDKARTGPLPPRGRISGLFFFS